MSSQREYAKASDDIVFILKRLEAFDVFNTPVTEDSIYIVDYGETQEYRVIIDKDSRGIRIDEECVGDYTPCWDYKNGEVWSDKRESLIKEILHELLASFQNFRQLRDSGILVEKPNPDLERVFGVLHNGLGVNIRSKGLGDSKAIAQYAQHLETLLISAPLSHFRGNPSVKRLRTATIMVKVDRSQHLDFPVVLVGLIKEPLNSVVRDSIFVYKYLDQADMRHYRVLGSTGDEFTNTVSVLHTLDTCAKRALNGIVDGGSRDPSALTFVDDSHDEENLLTAVHVCQVKKDVEVKGELKDKIVWVPFNEVNLSHTAGLATSMVRHLIGKYPLNGEELIKDLGLRVGY